VGLHSKIRSGRSTPSFLKHLHFDVLTVRTVNRTIITVQNRSDGAIAQPWLHRLHCSMHSLFMNTFSAAWTNITLSIHPQCSVHTRLCVRSPTLQQRTNNTPQHKNSTLQHTDSTPQRTNMKMHLTNTTLQHKISTLQRTNMKMHLTNTTLQHKTVHCSVRT